MVTNQSCLAIWCKVAQVNRRIDDCWVVEVVLSTLNQHDFEVRIGLCSIHQNLRVSIRI